MTEPTNTDIENIKKALVGAGVLKAPALSKADHDKLMAELKTHGVDSARLSVGVICSTKHYCLVIPK